MGAPYGREIELKLIAGFEDDILTWDSGISREIK